MFESEEEKQIWVNVLTSTIGGMLAGGLDLEGESDEEFEENAEALVDEAEIVANKALERYLARAAEGTPRRRPRGRAKTER